MSEEHTSPLYWSRSEGPQIPLDGYSILIVDGQEEVMGVLQEAYGVKNSIYFAQSGAQALALLEDHTFDVVLLDPEVPGVLGGAQTITHMKESQPELSVVIHSSHIASYARGLSGADEFVQKPIDVKRLTPVLKYFAELTRLRRASGRRKR